MESLTAAEGNGFYCIGPASGILIENGDVLVTDLNQQIIAGLLEVQRAELAVVACDLNRIVVAAWVADRVGTATRGAEAESVVARGSVDGDGVVSALDGHGHSLRCAVIL